MKKTILMTGLVLVGAITCASANGKVGIGTTSTAITISNIDNLPMSIVHTTISDLSNLSNISAFSTTQYPKISVSSGDFITAETYQHVGCTFSFDVKTNGQAKVTVTQQTSSYEPSPNCRLANEGGNSFVLIMGVNS